MKKSLSGLISGLTENRVLLDEYKTFCIFLYENGILLILFNSAGKESGIWGENKLFSPAVIHYRIEICGRNCSIFSEKCIDKILMFSMFSALKEKYSVYQ